VSVGAAFEFVTRPFATRGDIGYPAGMWAVLGSVTQDESGGTRTLTHLFQVLPDISNSNFYNIEQIDAYDSSGQGRWALETTGMDALFLGQQDAAANSRFWRLGLIDISAAGPQVFASELVDAAWRPLFLGQPSRNPSLSALLIATLDNEALNPGTFYCRIQGYFWAPGAMNTVGGLKRPEWSLYGQ